MRRFVIRENIRHYRELLETRTDARERAPLLELLAEECRKAEAYGDCEPGGVERQRRRAPANPEWSEP